MKSVYVVCWHSYSSGKLEMDWTKYPTRNTARHRKRFLKQHDKDIRVVIAKIVA